jgi:hypothetical protein
MLASEWFQTDVTSGYLHQILIVKLSWISLMKPQLNLVATVMYFKLRLEMLDPNNR